MKTTVKCKLDIEKGIIRKAIDNNITKTIKKLNYKTLYILHSDYNGNSFPIAQNVAKSINKDFNSELAFTEKKRDGSEITIKPNFKLIDEYYKEYVKLYNINQTLKQSIDQFGDSDTNLEDLYRNAMNLDENTIEERLKQCE